MLDQGRWERAQALFHSVAGMDPSARTAFLASACLHDPALQESVEHLLTLSEAGESVLDSPVVRTTLS